jgi:hypothetical protein
MDRVHDPRGRDPRLLGPEHRVQEVDAKVFVGGLAEEPREHDVEARVDATGDWKLKHLSRYLNP